MHPQGAQFFDESIQQSDERGRTETKAAAVITVLEARGFVVSEEQRERIISCDDIATLDRWIRRAATISRADELFID